MLVAGADSPCAAHVTALPEFDAQSSGRLVVLLEGAQGTERFAADEPSVAGIFRPVLRPSRAGTHRLVVEIEDKDWTARHDLGEVEVLSSITEAAALTQPEAAGGSVAFLKEQQWPIEFGVAAATLVSMRPVVRSYGLLRARIGGEVTIDAPIAGRVMAIRRSYPSVSSNYEFDELAAAIAPRLEAADLASLQLAVDTAKVELAQAQRERKRAEALFEAGTIAERRLWDSRYSEDDAKAAAHAARRRLAQHRKLAGSTGQSDGRVDIRAPLAGTVTAVFAAPGEFVEAGAPLFRVTDLSELWLEARVPAADIEALHTVDGALYAFEGDDNWLELEASTLRSRGHVVDPHSRTIPVSFAISGMTPPPAVGTAARVQLYTGRAREVVSVPFSAVIDDGFARVVFVQVSGESFERRIVTVGQRQRDLVEIVEGLDPGERVVTRGAWSVKLASASGGVPAHGHLH